MMTSWNWCLLTDFAPFKPTWLADYNPTDFNFFFHGLSDHAHCYIAPERFYASAESTKWRDPALTPAMDIFSLGCVIAEVFLEGEALFDYSQLLQYRDQKFDPSPALSEIEPATRAMIMHMLQLEPGARWSAQRYVDEWCPHIFPSYFPYLYSLFAATVRPELATPDAKIRFLKHSYVDLLEQLCNVPAAVGVAEQRTAADADFRALAQQEQVNNDDFPDEVRMKVPIL